MALLKTNKLFAYQINRYQNKTQLIEHPAGALHFYELIKTTLYKSYILFLM